VGAESSSHDCDYSVDLETTLYVMGFSVLRAMSCSYLFKYTHTYSVFEG